MEILNTISVSGKGTFVFFLLAFAAGLYAVLMFQDEDWISGLLMSALAIVLMLFAIGNLAKTPRTRYEVSFDENYSVSELIENYEIVDQRGDILIVEEKNK